MCRKASNLGGEKPAFLQREPSLFVPFREVAGRGRKAILTQGSRSSSGSELWRSKRQKYCRRLCEPPRLPQNYLGSPFRWGKDLGLAVVQEGAGET